MIDPLAIGLFSVLRLTSEVHTDDVCFWDSSRASAVLVSAHMRRHWDGIWRPTELTTAWMEEMFSEIRQSRPADAEFDPRNPEAGLPPQEPLAPAHSEASLPPLRFPKQA